MRTIIKPFTLYFSFMKVVRTSPGLFDYQVRIKISSVRKTSQFQFILQLNTRSKSRPIRVITEMYPRHVSSSFFFFVFSGKAKSSCKLCATFMYTEHAIRSFRLNLHKLRACRCYTGATTRQRRRRPPSGPIHFNRFFNR